MSPLTDLIQNHPNEQFFDLPPLPLDAEGLARDFRHYYAHTFGRDRDAQSVYYSYKALSITLRDRLMERWKRTRQAYDEAGCKRTYYLSLEFLMGRALSNAMLNLGINSAVEQGLYGMGLALEDIAGNEPDAGLGNGGLGRLAACFLDSCATLQLPVRGYGLRYEYGMFRQLIEGGDQLEEPDHWLRDGNPWELERPEFTQRIPFGGRTETSVDRAGRNTVRWVDTHDVLAVPYDIPVPGYRNETVNTLRLWKSAATDEFDLGEFNAGSYPESVAQKNEAEHITMVLYPNDASECGKELRLRQQFFLASASIKDVLRDWIRLNGSEFSRFRRVQLLPAQRYPSRRVGRRAHAPTDGRTPSGVGRGLGHYPPDHGLHQPYAAARGPGTLAGATVPPIAAAHPGNHLRDQRPLSGGSRDPLAGRQRPSTAHVAHRGGL